jgi:hypothetical protein
MRAQHRHRHYGEMILMKWLSIVLCAGFILLAVSCGDDGPVDPPYGPIPPVIRDLTHKTDVLNNIEYAYNKRRPDVYNALLDDNFTFSYTDVGGGAPVQWGRDVESTTTAALLGDASKIDMDIAWEDGVMWNEQPTGSEIWFFTTVFYHYTIKIGATTYIPSSGAKARFTVRNDGTAEKLHWKLVEFSDLGVSQ